MKVFFGVLIVLVVITLAEGGGKQKLDKAAKKCNKMNNTFEGCMEKGYKSICEESDDDNGEFKASFKRLTSQQIPPF